MFFSTMIAARSCGVIYPFNDKGKLNTAGKVAVAAILGDAVVSISALAIAILSMVGIMNGLPPAATYTLFGVSGFITLSWILQAAISRGGVFRVSARILKSAFSCSSKATRAA